MRTLLRSLIRHPLHPALATLILAAGLATSVSTFTYLRAFDRSFPGVDDRGLVRLMNEQDDGSLADLPYLDYLDYQEASSTLELGAVQRYYAASVRHEESAEVAAIEAVAGEYFQVLGARAHLGRLLGPDDDRPGADPAAVIAFGWWQSTFGGREEVLGETLILNGRPFTVVGVASPDFRGSNADARPRVWMPLAPFRTRYTNWDALAEDRNVPLVTVLGRVRPGATMASARAEVAALAGNLERVYPRAASPRRIQVRPATWIDPTARAAEAATLRIMKLAALGFLLLVCANVANVLLSLESTRSRATAIRSAVGASPGRIVGEVIARNLLLSIVAGVVGIALAVPLSRRLGDYFARPSVWGQNVPRDFSLDPVVVAFGIALAILAGLIASLPALRAARSTSPGTALYPGADVAVVTRGRRALPVTLRDVLVATQSGLAVALLILSGLVLRTFMVTGDVNPGFETGDLVGALVSVSSLGIDRTESRAFFDGLMADLEEEPWVRSVAGGDRLPLAARPQVPVRTGSMSEGVPVRFETVRHDFMETLGLPVAEGRDFQEDDEAVGDLALLNQAAASRFFPDGNAVGATVTLPEGTGERRLRVIGVVADARMRELLAEPEPGIFVQFRDEVWPSTNALLIRTAGRAEAAMTVELRRWLRDYAPHLTVINAVSYREVLDGALYTQRMNAELFTGVALLGLLLACAGIFSVVSLSVARRRREIGIRKALGAPEGRIRILIIRRALIPVLAGGTVGLAVALAGAGLAESLLFGVSPLDPASVAFGGVLLLVGAATAAAVPAWAASRIPPRESLVA